MQSSLWKHLAISAVTILCATVTAAGLWFLFQSLGHAPQRVLPIGKPFSLPWLHTDTPVTMGVTPSTMQFTIAQSLQSPIVNDTVTLPFDHPSFILHTANFGRWVNALDTSVDHNLVLIAESLLRQKVADTFGSTVTTEDLQPFLSGTITLSIENRSGTGAQAFVLQTATTSAAETSASLKDLHTLLEYGAQWVNAK